MVMIELPSDVIERVDRLAAVKGCSRDELIATALATGLREAERDQDVAYALDELLAGMTPETFHAEADSDFKRLESDFTADLPQEQEDDSAPKEPENG